MRSRARTLVASVTLAAIALSSGAVAAEPKSDKARIREGAYYEFRGRMSDRNTLEHTFTLGWDKGSQVIAIAPDTKVFRRGRAARIDDAKSGDAAHGFGRVVKGRFVAIAVAFGDEGVQLPASVKIPESITLPPAQSAE
jgi:hypothetical protein